MDAGQLVREARLRAGLSQRQLAEKAGVSQPLIARIERGHVAATFDRLQTIVQACGLELRVALTEPDDADWSVAVGNLALTPEARVRQHQAALRFARAGREALARERA